MINVCAKRYQTSDRTWKRTDRKQRWDHGPMRWTLNLCHVRSKHGPQTTNMLTYCSWYVATLPNHLQQSFRQSRTNKQMLTIFTQLRPHPWVENVEPLVPPRVSEGTALVAAVGLTVALLLLVSSITLFRTLYFMATNRLLQNAPNSLFQPDLHSPHISATFPSK